MKKCVLTECQPSHTFADCGPATVNVTISDGLASTNASLDVVVPCLFQITRLQAKLNFAKTNADSCTVEGVFDFPSSYSFAGKLVALDVGGAEVTFNLDSTGGGQNGLHKFRKPKYNKQTGLWTLKATLKRGSWQMQWVNHSMINANIPKLTMSVALPVTVVIDNEAFAAERRLMYTAKAGKSGTAK